MLIFSWIGRLVVKVSFIFLLIGVSLIGQGQSFFKPIPKRAESRFERLVIGDSVAPSTYYMVSLRPVTNALTYYEGGKDGQTLMAGTGPSIQWLHVDPTTNKWYADYSINALIYGGGTLSPPQSAIVAVGLSFGLFNGLLNFGAAYNFSIKNFGPTLGINIPLNN